MFYETTIKSVTGSGAVDVQGRRLNFIGYLPVKAGDKVFTDGKLIFGNAPPKGSSAVFDEQSGIPVLSDDLRGYFTTKGAYKKYKIAGKNWIVNSEKKYAHDTDEDDGNIIDAEIAADGNTYTVTKKVTRTSSDYPIRFYMDGIWYLRDGNGTVFGYCSMRNAADWSTVRRMVGLGSTQWHYRESYIKIEKADYATGDGEEITTCKLIITKDGKKTEPIHFADLVAPFEKTAKELTEVEVPNREHEDTLWTRLVVDNFKIKPDGNWEAVITVEVLARRTIIAENLTRRLSLSHEKTEKSHTIPIEEDTVLDEETYGPLARAGNAFIAQFDALTRPRSISAINWDFTVNDVPQIIASEYSVTFAHCVYTLKVKSDAGKPETLFENVFVAPLLFVDYDVKRIDDVDWKYTKSIPIQRHGSGIIAPYDPYGDLIIVTVDSDNTDRNQLNADMFEEFDILPDEDGNFTYPQVDTYISRQVAGSSWIIAASNWISYDAERNYNLWNVYSWRVMKVYDSRKMPEAPDYNPVNNLADEFNFHVQDEFSAKLKSYQAEASGTDEYEKIEQVYWSLGGVFNKENRRVVNEIFTRKDNSHQWNMSLVPLKDEQFLFGIRDDPDRKIDGKLYKVHSDGQLEQVGNGLKNFRLRELKNIRKAKK